MKPNLQVLEALRKLTADERNALMVETIDATIEKMSPLERLRFNRALGKMMNIRGMGEKTSAEFVLTLAINDALPKMEVM